MTDREWSALAVDIAKFLMTFPSKQQFHDFLDQLLRDHPEERARLFGVAFLFEFSKRYPPDVLESMARGAERLLQELEPFGDHSEDYFFTPLLNAGWIKGETLFDQENPPTLAELAQLKGMLDRDRARQSVKAETARGADGAQEPPVLRMVRQLVESGQVPRKKSGEPNISQTAKLVSEMIAQLAPVKRGRIYKEGSSHMRALVKDALENIC